MKKIYSTFLGLALLSGAVVAQSGIELTNYKGAFGKTDWTSGWANWDPQSVAYPNTNKTVDADITTNTTWAAGSVVLLKNKVYVTNNATLTIEPGVIIRGDKATAGSLIISRGSKLIANGTVAKPIVFTSNEAKNSRAPGDWGGLIILGKAVNNQVNGVAIVEGGLDPVKAEYGGTDDADNSGSLKYIRIEFAGYPFQPDKEINGLTMGSVGSGTTIDYIQVSFCNDDSYEWFGGTVNAKHLIAYRGVDDDFDTDFGYRGHVQFALGVRDPNLADQCACSTSEGFESDNDGAGSAATPQTAAMFYNVTEVGPYRGSTANVVDAKHKRALRIRRNSALSLHKSVFTDFPEGLHLDGSATEQNAVDGKLMFQDNLLAGMKTYFILTAGGPIGTIANLSTWFDENRNDTLATTTDLMVNPYDFTNPDFRPKNNNSILWLNTGEAELAPVTSPISGIRVYPNPAKGNAVIELDMKESGNVSIQLYHINGQLAKTVINETLQTGVQRLNMDVADLSNGIYIAQVTSLHATTSLRLVVSE